MSDPQYLAIPMDKWDTVFRNKGKFEGPFETTNSMRLAELDAARYASEHSSQRAIVVKLDARKLTAINIHSLIKDHRHRADEFSYHFIGDLAKLFWYVVGQYFCGPDLPDDPDDGNY